MSAVSRSSRGLLLRRGASGVGWLHRHYKEKKRLAALEELRLRTPKVPLAREGHERKRAFLEFAQGKKKLGFVEIELTDDLTPLAADNFLKLCAGETDLVDEKFGYKGTEVFQVKSEEWILSGDVRNLKGHGGHSAFKSQFFRDEGYFFRHSWPGIVSLANSGVHRNNSCFLITLKPCNYLDGTMVPFGIVTEGLEVLQDIGKTLAVNREPLNEIIISDCGALD